MRSYGQYCSLARALDLVGDRWTFLIVRELAVRPCRYSDLRDGLPGLATNLLAERLRNLTTAGIVRKVDAPPPIGTAVYELTEWGSGLVPVAVDLARWADRLMYEPPREGEIFRARWMVLAVPSLLGDCVDDASIAVRVRFEMDEPVDVVVRGGAVVVELHAAERPDAVVKADPYTTMGLIAGALRFDEPVVAPLVTGDAEALRTFESVVRSAALARDGDVSAPPATTA